MEGNEKTAFSNWKILRGTFTKSLGRRKSELKNKIEILDLIQKMTLIYICYYFRKWSNLVRKNILWYQWQY